jgi:hypothetical protein
MASGSSSGSEFRDSDVSGAAPSGDSGRAVGGMNCLRQLKHWGRGFESYSMHGCLCAFILFCVAPCVDSGLASVLPTV